MSIAETIGSILNLEIDRERYISDISRVSSSKFKNPPAQPQKNAISIPYPEIPKMKTDKRLWFLPPVAVLFIGVIGIATGNTIIMGISSVLSLLPFPWIIVYRAVIFPKIRAANFEEIQSSPEYQLKCSAIDEEVKRKQDDEDKNYELKMREHKKAMDIYSSENIKFELDKNERLKTLKDELFKIEASLNIQYHECKLIPAPYRSIEALEYIYKIVSTSDIDVKSAIDMYDRQQQRELEALRAQQQAEANYLADEQNQLLYKHGELLSEQNKISEKARRDQNIASTAAAIQRHNLNKHLKEHLKGRR